MNNESQFDLPLSHDGHGFAPSPAVVLTPRHEQLLEQLAYSAQFNGGVQVIEGQSNSGKTTLAQVLCEDYLAQAEPKYIAVGEDSAGALHKASIALGLPADPEQPAGELVVALRHHVQALQSAGEVAILVVDDAQKLDQRTLAAFASLLQGATETGFGLHLVLWSEPGLVERLDELQLVDIPVHDFEVPELTLEETAGFLQRLSESGVDVSTSPADIERLWSGSHGRIGLLVQNAFSGQRESITEDEPRTSGARWTLAGMPAPHVGALGLLVVVLIWALLVREPAEEHAPESRGTAEGRVAAPLEIAQAPPADEAANSAVDDPAPTSQSLDVAMTLDPVIDDDELRQAIYGRGSAQDRTPEADEEPSAGVNEEPSAGVSEEPSAEADEEPSANEQPSAGETSVATGKAAADDPSAESPVDTPSASQANAQGQAQYSSAPGDQPAGGQGDLEQLMSLDPDSYSLQIMAASSVESLKRFRSAQPNRAELFLYQTRRQGKDWHILLAGSYPSKSAASNAIAQLPANQRAAGPWPRKLESVQQEIAEIREF